VRQALRKYGGSRPATCLLNTLQPAPALQFTTLASWEVLPQEAQAYVTKKEKGATCSVLLWGSVQGFGSGKNEQQAAESAAADALAYLHVCGARFSSGMLPTFKRRPPVPM